MHVFKPVETSPIKKAKPKAKANKHKVSEKPKPILEQTASKNKAVQTDIDTQNTPVTLVTPESPSGSIAPVSNKSNIAELAKNPFVSAHELLDAQFPIPTRNNFFLSDFPEFGGAKKKEVPATPKSAAEDPNFIALKGTITATASQQSTHQSATSASEAAQKAAPSPANEQLSTAQATQVAVMDQQEAGEFSAADFKKQLQGRIAEMELPKNEEAADDFENNNNIDTVNKKALGDVSNTKDAASGAIANTAAAKPDTSIVTKRQTQALPTPKFGKTPSIPGAGKAMPPKRTSAEVEQPLQEQTSSVDSQMAENNVTDAMLANSNEASFTGALAEKNAAKTQSAAATTQFRNQEVTGQQNLQNQAQQETQNQVGGMNAARTGGLDKVAGNQKETTSKNSAARKKIADKVNTIYTATKERVDTLLSGLDTEVASKFMEGSKQARIAFENHVATKMIAYKKERYGDSIFSFKQLRRVGDAFVGLPKEVNEFFVSGREVYIKTMDVYVTAIANLVAQKLNEAKAIIATGKTEVKTYVDGLSPELKKLGKEAAANIEDKFDSLEQTVDDKKEALIDTLAEKYAENLASVDSRIEKLKAANEGLVNKALGALKGVFDFIIKIKNTLTNLLSKIVEVVVAIITDPIGFFKNLIAGVGQGFSNFGANIMKHLQTGFIGWLTGAMKGVSITMPEDVFSLKGIFSLTMQVLGLGWQGIRTIGAKVIGEPIMKAIETGVEIVQIIRKDGIAGLWEHLKEQFNDLKATVMDAIMSMIQTQVIQAGIKWILGLLSPVGAFVKAAMAIVDVVKFFIERAAQIGELVSAFIDSVAAIAGGKVGAVAKSIENALGKAIPVLIGLLASILGIGGIANKVVGLIRKVQKRITKAITTFWLKVKAGAGKLLRKLGVGKKKKGENNKENKAKEIDVWDDKVSFTNIENEEHTLYFKEKENVEELYMQSKDDHVLGHLNTAKTVAETDSEKANIEVGLTHYNNQVLPINRALSKLENERVKLINSEGDKKKQITAKDKVIADKNKKQDEVLEKLAELFKMIKFEDKVKPTTVKTKVTSKQDSKGRPVYVEASPLTWIAGNTTGSSPYQKPTGWSYAQDVEDIRKGIYIRGHMLNDNIHGPGVTWNLVPITRVMNTNMEIQAESKGKEVLEDGNRNRIMWYKTTIIDYFDDSNNPSDIYFPTELLVEWGEFKNNKDVYDASGSLRKIDEKKFKQGRPALPYNINDLGEILLKSKLGIDAKFAKAITEERKANGWFDDQDFFETRMDIYYETRKDKNILETGLDTIEILVSTNELIF